MLSTFSKITPLAQIKDQLYGSCKNCLPSQKCIIILPNNLLKAKPLEFQTSFEKGNPWICTLQRHISWSIQPGQLYHKQYIYQPHDGPIPPKALSIKKQCTLLLHRYSNTQKEDREQGHCTEITHTKYMIVSIHIAPISSSSTLHKQTKKEYKQCHFKYKKWNFLLFLPLYKSQIKLGIHKTEAWNRSDACHCPKWS